MDINEPKTIAFTGHRRKDLDINEVQFHAILEDTINDPRDEAPVPLSFVTGGALGIDTWAAQYALDENIPLTIILPFRPEVMIKMWRPEDAHRLLSHMERADHTQIMTDGPYNPWYYQLRNQRMVDASDIVWAYWTGKRFGGTWNCIQYAISVSKPPWNLRTKEWIR